MFIFIKGLLVVALFTLHIHFVSFGTNTVVALYPHFF